MRPPRLFTSLFRTSMPMPRPERRDTSLAVEIPGGKNQLHHARRIGGFVLGQQAGVQTAFAQPVEVEAGAVIGERRE
jgi:hypothetical protein